MSMSLIRISYTSKKQIELDERYTHHNTEIVVHAVLKLILGLMVSVSVLAQSLIYDSGLCYMRTYRQICTCNHNSKKEIHRQTNKSDCHDKSKSVHICSCKKSKNPNELSNLLKQIFFLWQGNQDLALEFIKFNYSTLLKDVILNGYGLTLIKPPRLS